VSLGAGVGQDAAVEDAAGDDRDAASHAERQKLLRAAPVQERVAAGEQEAIEIRLAGKASQHLGLVHSRADRRDRAVRAQPVERAIRAAQRLVVMVVRVVDQQHVDTIEGEPREAFLDRAHHTVIREIENGIERRDALERLVWVGGRVGAQQTPDLGGQDEFVARLGAQHRAETALGQTAAVERRGVEEPDTCVPGRLDDAMTFVVGQGLVQAAERGSAQAKLRDLEPSAAEGDSLQSSKINFMRSLLSPLKS
jgi:hypothetical protein